MEFGSDPWVNGRAKEAIKALGREPESDDEKEKLFQHADVGRWCGGSRSLHNCIFCSAENQRREIEMGESVKLEGTPEKVFPRKEKKLSKKKMWFKGYRHIATIRSYFHDFSDVESCTEQAFTAIKRYGGLHRCVVDCIHVEDSIEFPYVYKVYGHVAYKRDGV